MNRVCPQCRTESMVSTAEFSDPIPANVIARIQRAYPKKKDPQNANWWFCELCGYCADLEAYLRRWPTKHKRRTQHGEI